MTADDVITLVKAGSSWLHEHMLHIMTFGQVGVSAACGVTGFIPPKHMPFYMFANSLLTGYVAFFKKDKSD